MSDTPAPASGRIAFSEQFDLRSFLVLSLITGALTVITLGIYAAWGFTRVVKRLAASVMINGEPLVYVGRGSPIFLGFLSYLVAAYAPLLVFIVLNGGQPPWAWALIGLWLLLIAFLAGAGFYLLLRYMVSRTLWRGVRFSLTGSPWGFALKLLGFLALMLVTVFWYAPAAGRRLYRHGIGRLSLGGEPFAFDMAQARQRPVYPTFAVYWAGGFLLNLLQVVVSVGSKEAADGLGFLSMFALTALKQPFAAAMARSVAQATTFDRARFAFDLRAGELVGMAMVCLLLVVFSVGLLLPLAMAIGVRFYVRRLRAEGEADLERIVRSADPSPPPPGLAALLRGA